MRCLAFPRCSLIVLALAISCWAAGPALAPSIDFGWLKATLTNQGWLLTYVYTPASTGDALRSGDVLISVDHQKLEELSPFSAAHVLKGIGSAQSAIVHRDQATVRLNFLSADERVTPLPRYLGRSQWPTRTYKRDVAAPSLTMPDPDRVMHSLAFGAKWTLLHVWNSFCNIGVDALNEMANPAPPDLRIVGIEVGHHPQDVRANMRSRGLTFFTLVAEDVVGFSQDFDPSINDIIVDPEGRVVFMAAGDDSLRNAYLFYRSHSAWQTPQR